ncbi:Terpene synthase [Pleurotus pulmonarius]
MLPLPSQFRLPDLTSITAPVFELRQNVHAAQANICSEAWLSSVNVFNEAKRRRFLSCRFDNYAAMAFPDADKAHLETCINFFFWAFSFDDLSDEGDLQSMPDHHQASVNITLGVFKAPLSAPSPKFAYAAMLHDLWRRLNATATPGACARFAQATENWCNSQVWQCANRADHQTPSVADFITMRRYSIGGAMVEAMIEYAYEINLPDHVFDDPIIRAMSDATTDIMTWPNDICSFNKEQADGDYQNLVYCVMVEHKLNLQDAIDRVVQMLRDRIVDYVELKKCVPSFGPDIDSELLRYLRYLENYVQGTVVWYYSPRYFRDLDLSNLHDLVVPVYKCAPTARHMHEARAQSAN